MEAERVANLTCFFPKSGPAPPLLTTNQILSLAALLTIVAWRYIAIFVRVQKNKKKIANGEEVEDEEYSLIRTDGRKVVWWDCGRGGPIDVWMWILTKLPCVALGLGLALPAFLSYEGLRQSSFTMEVDMDFAGYVKTETQMQLHQDALGTARWCRSKAISSYEDARKQSQQQRRLNSFGFPFVEDFDDENEYVGSTEATTFDELELHQNYTFNSRDLAKKATRKKGPYWTLDIFYEAITKDLKEIEGVEGGSKLGDFGVFSDVRLTEIREFEKELMKFPGYDGHDQTDKIFDQCWRLKSSKNPCELPQSPVNIFFGTYQVNKHGNSTSGAFDGKGPLNNIERVLKDLLKQNILIFTDLEFAEDHLKSSFTRSRFRGHGPGAHKFLENIHNKLFSREQDPLLRKYKNIKITWSESSHLKTYEVFSALVHDAWFALGSFAFVATFVLIHLGSFLLAGFAIYGILISFPAAYYFFYVVMGFRKMMILNFVSLFLIMGIGADDVFVMYDAYNQAAAALGVRSSPGQRLRWAYLEAGSAMLVTTVTTAGSFFSNCVSEVVVVRQFGFFMGVVVVLNWFHVMVIFPSFLLIYEIWWGRCWRHCCCCLHRFCPEPQFDDDDDIQVTDEDDIEISADEAVADIERHHAEETAARKAALDEQQQKQHARLQDRLTRRHSGVTPAKKVPKKSTAINASPRATGRMAMMTKSKLAMESKKSDTEEQKVYKEEVKLLSKDKDEGELDLHHLGRVERCFNQKFSPFLYILRLPLCLSMIGLAVIGVIMVIQNFTPGDAPTIFLEDRNLGRLQRIMEESGLGELSTAQEKQVMSQYPSKHFIRKSCPGLLPDGLTYCNGRGDCPFSRCSTDPKSCEAATPLEKSMLFVCKCEAQWSGYNCSKSSVPGSLALVRRISHRGVDQFSTTENPVLAPAPNIQVLIFNEQDSTQEAELINVHDWEVQWKLLGVGKVQNNKLSLLTEKPGWLNIQPEFGTVPAASYLTPDGIPLPGKNKEKIKFTVTGAGKENGWYNEDESVMFVMFEDITANRPAHHLNFTRRSDFTTKYMAALQAWAPPTGKLNSFNLEYQTDRTQAGTFEDGTTATSTSTTTSLKSNTNKIFITSAKTEWFSKNTAGERERSVGSISVDVEKKWPDGKKNRRTVSVSTVDIGNTLPIEISALPEEDFVAASGNVRAVICNIFVIISSRGYKSNTTYTYTLERSSPPSPGKLVVKFLQHSFSTGTVTATFVRPNSELEQEANIQSFVPILRVMDSSTYAIDSTYSDYPEQLASDACSGGVQWQDESGDCSIAVEIPPNRRGASYAYELIVKPSNGIKTGDPSESFVKPTVKQVNGHAYKEIYAAVSGGAGAPTPPIIPADAITYTTHKQAIYLEIDMEKIQPGHKSPLSIPKCEARKVGGTPGSSIVKNTIVALGAKLATVLFSDLDDTQAYQIECWCDSTSPGNGKTGTPTIASVLSTVPSFNIQDDDIQFVDFPDYGTAASGQSTSPFVYASLTVKIADVTAEQEKCCTMVVTCDCDKNGAPGNFLNLLNSNATMSTLTSGTDKDITVNVLKIPRGEVGTPSVCKFKCSAELRLKKAFATTIDMYEVQGGRVATLAKTEKVNLAPPSPPKACDSGWTNKDPTTINTENQGNWPVAYKKVNKMAALNISDVVIPMQRDDTSGEPTRFSCTLTEVINSDVMSMSTRWVSTHPNNPSEASGTKVLVVFPGATVNIGARYTANCYSWIQTSRSETALAISEFTVGSTAPAPVIRTFAVEEQIPAQIPRKVGFVVQVKPIFHNPSATKICCTATKDDGTKLTEETAIIQDLIEMIATGKRCEVGVSVGDSNNEKICARKVLHEQKCEPGGGKFQFNSNSQACKCCTSGDPSVNVPGTGTNLYQLPDVVVNIPTTGSAFSADGNNVVLQCKAINSIGDSTLSTTKTLPASLPPKKPTSVTVNSVTTSSVEIAVVSVTSESDRGGKTLTKKTCRACGLFPTWCPTGVIGTGKASGCCWSTSEVEVNDMSTSAAVTINSKLVNGMEYLIECRSHHDHGISPFARISSPGVVYVGALPLDSVVFDNSALSFDESTQKATLNVNIASYIIDDKHEGTDILGVKCESVSGAVTAVKCISPAVKSADKSDCDVPASAAAPSIELSGGIYTNTDADPWCDLNTDLSVAPAGKNWAGLGTCGYGSKILDKDEYCFPTCTLPKEPYGSVLCKSNIDGTATTVIDFECKTPAERNSLPNTGSACNIVTAKNQVQNLAESFQGNCAYDNLSKEQGCTPECKAGFKAEGQMYCNKNGVLTNNFRCMLPNTLTMKVEDGLDLATGTTYEFKCKIKNRLGWSTASSATSNSVTPQSKPSPPTITSVFNGVDKQLTVSYSPTSDDAANFPYKCQANMDQESSNGVDQTSIDGTAITLTGLSNNERYWVSCTAENGQGVSDRAEFSKSVLVGISPSDNLVSFTPDDSAKLLDGDKPTSGYIEVKLTVNAGGVEPAVNKILCRACLQNTQTCSDSETEESPFPAQLKITGLIAGSTYRVECQVESPLGVNSLHSTLTPPGWQEVLPSETVVTKPNSPTNVVAVIHSTDERKVQVTFTAPELDGNNAIVGYRCGVMPMDIHFDNWVAVGNTAREVTLAELTAGQQITVGCSAENAKGWSIPGQTVGKVEPISLPPTMIPGKVETIADKSKAGITGQLQIFAAFPVDDNSGGQNIDCYQCQGRDSSGTDIEMAAVTSQCDVSNGIAETMPSDGIIVVALTLSEKYSFKCRARNALGWGNWSNSSDTATAANVPPAPEVLTIVPSFEQISLKLVSPTAETLRAATGYDQVTDRECKIYYNKQEPSPEIIVDVPAEKGSGIIHVDNLQNKELVSLKCKQENAAGWGPWSTDFSDTVVPGQAVTSVIEPTESMTTLPLKSAVRSRLAMLIEVSENNVVIESMSLEEIKFRVTVESSLTTGIKEMIETNIQTSTDLIELLQVTQIKDVIAAIESDTYNSADLAVVRVFSKGGANLLHTFENSVAKNPLNETMLEFIVPSNSAKNLELEIRIYPVGGQNLLSLSSNGSYLLSEEEQSETAFITGKICGDDNIAVNQACEDAYGDTGKRDAYENLKYYYLGNIFIRRTSPDYEQITVVVTAENNILKKEYNIRLKYLPEDCSHCNQTLTYRDPTDNQTMVVVEPGGECSLLTGECMCDPGYQGTGCNSYCPNNCGDDGDDSSKGSSEHGVCSDGRCVCDSGWGGAACDRMQCPVCLNGGNCTGTSSMCMCPPAWKGTACDEAVCECGKSGHGKCEQNSQKCQCFESWSGDDCEDFLKFKFEETIKLSFVWGFAEQNKGVVVDSKGKIPVRPLLSSEPAIDLSAAASQLHFLDFCRMARQDVKLQTRPELLCWVETFAESLGVDLSKNNSASGSVSFPVSREKFAGSVSTFMDGSNNKGGKFNTDIDIDPRNPTKSHIRWVSVHMRVDVSQDSDATILQPVWKQWKQFVDNMNARPGSTTTGPAVMISSQFTKMDQQLALIGSTVNGFMTSNLICLAAVLLFTGDIVISVYTMMAIILIVVTLLGFLFGILGWTFGAIEAVGVTIFVGMSVDYCLHTAHGYAHSASNTRNGKVTDALTHIGVSILGAFVTTAGSTLFLFPTWIYLFYQLGVMMFANTVLAVLFSFFFLSTILMTCGPTHGCGQITSILSCKCIRTIGQTDGNANGDEEDLDDDWDPDSLVGQIEAEQRREEREQKVRLEHQRMEEHARLQRRLENRKRNAKKKTKKTAVLPVAVNKEEDENKEDEEDENVI